MKLAILTLEAPPSRVRGYLSKYMVEVRTGMFVGLLNARIRQHLWDVISFHAPASSAIMIVTLKASPFGFAIQRQGNTWLDHDIEGVSLPLRRFRGRSDPYEHTRKAPPKDFTQETLL